MKIKTQKQREQKKIKKIKKIRKNSDFNRNQIQYKKKKN